ncbi:Imm44 family immunity protein [Neobacillus cucumis]|uniref:Imm44 family immunity protein n=1 Tax=Neobacillus cucumis TaxID=1740721 RepID=UPI002E226BEB|nr:Imm44 family immunity protein [Neobacillus cucumis]
MDIFLSGEIDKDVDEAFVEIRKDIGEKIKVLRTNEYGSELTSISIIPIIINITPELEAAGFFKERKLFKRKEKDADYRLRVNFENFFKSDRYTQKLMIVKNIIECIRSLSTKAKNDFDASSLERDILQLFDIDEETFNKIDIN